jgi:TonB family protein
MKSERMWDWTNGLAQRLVHQAAKRAPGTLSERLEEEWLADMSMRSTGFSRLRFAVGCCWATRVIARDHAVATVPATGACGAPASVAGYTRDDASHFSRRTATFLLVASIHAAVLGGLAVGLSSHFTKIKPTPFEAWEILKPQPVISLSPIDKPAMWTPTLDVPPVKDPQIEPEPEKLVVKNSSVGESQGADLAPSGTSTGPSMVNRVQGGPGIGFPTADDFYPSPAIRLGEQGVATVTACVDRTGRLTSDPIIGQTSGSSRLDQAALKLAKAGSGHYKPTTEDGQPVNSCYPFRIRFNLRN